jgi:hypothetical protein
MAACAYRQTYVTQHNTETGEKIVQHVTTSGGTLGVHAQLRFYPNSSSKSLVYSL